MSWSTQIDPPEVSPYCARERDDGTRCGVEYGDHIWAPWPCGSCETTDPHPTPTCDDPHFDPTVVIQCPEIAGEFLEDV